MPLRRRLRPTARVGGGRSLGTADARAAFAFAIAIGIAFAFALAVGAPLGCGAPSGRAPAADAGIDAAPAAPPCAAIDPSCGPPAGVAADGCGDGFATDGAGGCAPIRPATPCPFGQVAWLGETSCHDVSPCGDGRWGDAPDEPTTQYVDAAASGTSDGTKDHPWKTFADGVAAAADGAVIALAAGSYDAVVLHRPARVWGRCPALVDVHTGSDFVAIAVVGEDVYAEIHGVAVHGGLTGLAGVSGPILLIEGVWVHDTDLGIDAANHGLTLRNVLVERTRGGVSYGGTSAVTDLVVRDVGGGSQTVALQMNAPIAGPGGGIIRRAIIERCSQPAIQLFDDAVLDSVLVADTADVSPHPPIVDVYAAIQVSGANVRRPSPHVVLQRSVIARARGTAIHVSGSAFTLASSTITDTGSWTDGSDGNTLEATLSEPEPAPFVTIRASRIDGSTLSAMAVGDVDFDLDGLLVTDTHGDAPGGFGHGIDVGAFGGKAHGRITRTRIARSHEAALLVTGMTVTLDDVVVTDTMTNGTTSIADGIVAQAATLDLHDVVVARSARAGLSSFGGNVTIGDVVFVDDAIDIDGEPFGPTPYTFADRGGNACFTGAVGHACVALSAGLAPPTPATP